MAILVAEAAAFVDRMAVQGGPVPAVVLCGDLNSSYTDAQLPGCLELLRSGRLSEHYPDWAEGARYVQIPKGAPQPPADEEPRIDRPVGANLQLPLCLRSADRFSLPFTNVVQSYEVCACMLLTGVGLCNVGR